MTRKLIREHVGAGVDEDPSNRLAIQLEAAHDLDAAEAEHGDVEKHTGPGSHRLVRVLAWVAHVAGEVPAVPVVEDGPADLRFLTQASEVLLRRLGRVENQGGQGVLANHGGQHAEVAHHLAAEHPHVVDHEERADDAQREHRDGRRDAHQPLADRGRPQQAHRTTSATS